MNLKYLRKALDIHRKKEGISRTALEVLLYANHCETFDTADVLRNVTGSEKSVRDSLRSLTDSSLIKVVTERHHYRTRVYSVSGKGRVAINKLYKSIKTLDYYDGNWKAQIQI